MHADLVASDEIARDAQEREAAARLMRRQERADKESFDKTEAARRELARRELARQNYLPFVMRFNPDYMAGWVHKDICRRLEKFSEDVAKKRSPRLMLFMPPRHGKSLLTSKTFAAWHLGKYPTHEFMSCSYSGSLSMQFSRSVRSILRDPAYAGVFDTQLDPDSQSVESWLTTEGGGFVAAGVGGAITGKGAHILMIDDPVKNREDAESETARTSTYDWYTSTAYTRLAPGGGVLLILTRWHDDDLAGRLIKAAAEGGDQWEIVEYPAEAIDDEQYRAKGEPLHPARYDTEALARIRKAIGERDWWALYQQRPVADTGNYFTRDMFRYYRKDELDLEEMRMYTAWDLAIGQKEVNDWTVGATCGIDKFEQMWIVDRPRGRWDGFEITENIIDQFLKFRGRVDTVGIEEGQIKMTLGPFLQRRLDERKIYDIHIEPLKTGRRDKSARARSIQSLLRQGKVLLPHPDECEWTAELVDELLRFPNGVHDDQVDALAWLGIMIQGMMAYQEPVPEKKASWRDKLPQFIGNTNTRSAMSA